MGTSLLPECALLGYVIIGITEKTRLRYNRTEEKQKAKVILSYHFNGIFGYFVRPLFRFFHRIGSRRIRGVKRGGGLVHLKRPTRLLLCHR